MKNFLMRLDVFLWGVSVLVLLSAVGLLYAVKTRFFQFCHFKHIMKSTAGKMFKKSTVKRDRTLAPLQVVLSALAGCVGTGNISGVATAIFVGGPGAVSWIWIISLFGMLTRCVEVTLAQYYRIKGEDGVYYGGPMYYIERRMGRKWKPLAVFFAITIIVSDLGTAAFVQPFAVSNAMNNAFRIPTWVVIVTAVLICDMVLIGGVSGIGKFCEEITPVMCLIYIISVVDIILTHLPQIPQVLAATSTHAFIPPPATGGLAGSTVAMTIKQGAARGTFSNEADCGASPITHATAISPHPFKEGIHGSFEVFIDTLVVCTMTALAIMCSGPKIWQSGLKDVALTQSVFSTTYGSIGPVIVSVCLCPFAFSTMVRWEINYESAFFYIFPKASGFNAAKLLIRLIWLVPGFISLGKTPELVWTVVNIVSDLWCIPNAIALLFLSGTFIKIYNDYNEKYILKTRPLTDKLDWYPRGKRTLS